MSITRLTPDELLWKLAHLAADSENKAACETELWLDLQETTALLQQVKQALPDDDGWSFYLTPTIVWHTVWSIYHKDFENSTYRTRQATVQLVRECVESLKTALNTNPGTAEKRQDQLRSGLARGALIAP